ncbi:MAG: BolA family protein, partial [Pseudomonadota bacterium]
LQAEFEPDHIELANESELHAGHRGSPGTGESHFRVTVISAKFENMSRVARHRHINALLADELAAGVHALALHALTPDEAK